jgi:hypothetical protein
LFVQNKQVLIWALGLLLACLDWFIDLIAAWPLCGVLYLSGQNLPIHNPLTESLLRTRALLLERLFWLENGPNKARGLLNSYSKQTFPNVYQTIRYHHKKHGRGLSLYQYTTAALRHFASNIKWARLKQDKAGRESWNLRGDVGGWFTQAGQIITFWLPSNWRGTFLVFRLLSAV